MNDLNAHGCPCGTVGPCESFEAHNCIWVIPCTLCGQNPCICSVGIGQPCWKCGQPFCICTPFTNGTLTWTDGTLVYETPRDVSVTVRREGDNFATELRVGADTVVAEDRETLREMISELQNALAAMA